MRVMPAFAGTGFSEKALEPMPAGLVVVTFDGDPSTVHGDDPDGALEIGLQNDGVGSLQITIGVLQNSQQIVRKVSFVDLHVAEQSVFHDHGIH
jgi:hypothetical protein